MTPGLVMAAALAFAAATLVVHTLYRGARRTITVASLKPFEPESRPRLTLSTPTERALLACRLAFMALVAAIVIYERPVADAADTGADVVAVVPGTAPPAQPGDGRVVWLDGMQTPVETPPLRDDVTAGALLALAQSLDADARLAVSGALPARGWPAQSPRFGRAIDWLGGSRRSASKTGWAAEDAPSRIVVEGDDAELADAVREALALWRGAGLLPEGVGVDVGGATGGAAVIVLGAAADRDRDWYATVTREPRGDGTGVVYDPTRPPGAFATALWHALTARAGERPPPGTVVAPAPAGEAAGSLVQGDAMRRSGTPVAPAWLLLAVVLFATERALAARGAAR